MRNWFQNLSKSGKILTIALTSVIAFGTISAFAQPQTSSTEQINNTTHQSQQKKQVDSVETKIESKTESIPFTSSIEYDNSLEVGKTSIKTKGVNGERTIKHEVVYKNGSEVSREEISNEVTTKPVNEVVVQGTKTKQLNCPNGTYINTYGNEVCRPYESSSAPSGASAKCKDGTYSFSQSRRGTCSGHGGVATWL